VLAGHFSETIDMGNGTLDAVGGHNIFVMTLQP